MMLFIKMFDGKATDVLIYAFSEIDFQQKKHLIVCKFSWSFQNITDGNRSEFLDSTSKLV